MVESNQKSYEFDVFLAHNSKDKHQVKVIAEKLKQRQLKPWLDEDRIIAGDSIPHKVQEGLSQSPVAAFFIGLSGFGRFQKIWELDALCMLCCNKNVRFIAILLPGVDTLPQDLLLLSGKKYLQFHQSVKENQPFEELVNAIKLTRQSYDPQQVDLSQIRLEDDLGKKARRMVLLGSTVLGILGVLGGFIGENLLLFWGGNSIILFMYTGIWLFCRACRSQYGWLTRVIYWGSFTVIFLLLISYLSDDPWWFRIVYCGEGSTNLNSNGLESTNLNGNVEMLEECGREVEWGDIVRYFSSTTLYIISTFIGRW